MKGGMWKIKSFNFMSWDAEKTDLEEAKEQIDAMIGKCAINTVVITFTALQEHCYSTVIDWKGTHIFSDDQIMQLIRYARSREQKIVLKPMLNVRDGYWRAYIRFFDVDVPCEPKWRDWFDSYTRYMMHYAELCEKEAVDMLIIGCELVGTDHREKEWRDLIAGIRQVYSGMLTYNCDKYQEHNVAWWDAVDVISSSGYYPIDDWHRQLQRIEAVVKKFNKPFFFAEAGCQATAGCATVPNDGSHIGKRPADPGEQNRFYKTMFEKCEPLEWHYGYSLWDWPMNAGQRNPLGRTAGYWVVDKPAEGTIKHYYSKE